MEYIQTFFPLLLFQKQPGPLCTTSSISKGMAGRKGSKKSAAAFSLKQRNNKNNSYYFSVVSG